MADLKMTKMIQLANGLVLIVYVASCQELTIRDNYKSCTLATPNISFTSRGNFIELPEYILEEILPGDKLQVGYTQILGVFQYIGCSPETAIPANSTIHSTYPDPGQCYSLCRTKYFALNNKKCICLLQNLTTISGGCNRGCSFPKYTACGGADINSVYLSVYKYIESLNRTFDDGRFCYTYESETNMYKWQHCGIKLTGLCRAEGSVVDPRLLSRSDWKDYTVQCFDRKHTLVDGTHTQVLNRSFDAQYMWVGSIKTFFIESVHDTKLLFPDHRGYIRFDNDRNRYILVFDSSMSLVGSRFLCLKESLLTESTTEINPRNNIKHLVTKIIFVLLVTLISIVLIYILWNYKRAIKSNRKRTIEPEDPVDNSFPLEPLIETNDS